MVHPTAISISPTGREGGWRLTMMGKPGSLLRELTETRERALAWLFRGSLVVIMILSGGVVGLSTYFVYDLRDRSEKAWEAGGARMGRIEEKQTELISGMSVFRQIVQDRGELRDRELKDINRRLESLENKVK